MVEIPEDLLRRSAEAKAKALGLPVEQVLAEMKGEAPSSTPQQGDDAPPAPKPQPGATARSETETPDEKQADDDAGDASSTEAAGADETGQTDETDQAAAGTGGETTEETAGQEAAEAEPVESAVATATADEAAPTDEAAPAAEAAPTDEAAPAAEAAPTDEETPSDVGDSNGDSGNGRVAATVSPRPVAPPTGMPEGVRTQRLLTVVKARAIQQVKSEPSDKVNTWPHLMVAEFGALLAMTALLVVLSVILAAPLLEPANFNATPNPSKAPWYFLGLQELLSYFDPQIAGVTIPTIIGLVGFMMIPYVDRNPSTRPSDRKFAIMLFTLFLTGSATLTIIGVLFRAQGFNFAYPWEAGVYFDDLRDWVDFGLH